MKDDDFLSYTLPDLLTGLGEKALTSEWLCTQVECYGSNAEELHLLSDLGQRIDGKGLLAITQQLDSIADGYFYAFRQHETQPWLAIRATECGFYELESHDPVVDQFKQQLSSRPYMDPPGPGDLATERSTARIGDSLSTIAAALGRIQNQGNPRDNYVIFVADEEKNYYIQVCPESEISPYGGDTNSLYGEAVGNEYLDPKNVLQPDQILCLQSLGWRTSPSTPNFIRFWRGSNDVERNQAARDILKTFMEIYRISPAQKIDVCLNISA